MVVNVKGKMIGLFYLFYHKVELENMMASSSQR